MTRWARYLPQDWIDWVLIVVAAWSAFGLLGVLLRWTPDVKGTARTAVTEVAKP